MAQEIIHTITYGFDETPYGAVLIGKTDAGVCWISFVQHDKDAHDDVKQMKNRLRAPNYIHDDNAVSGLWHNNPSLDLHGTVFQKKIWAYLQTIPSGQTVSYGDIAHAVGIKKGARAIGGAVGANPVSLLVPCHRVIRSDGTIGGYAWGVERKQDILRAEAQPLSPLPSPLSVSCANHKKAA